MPHNHTSATISNIVIHITTYNVFHSTYKIHSNRIELIKQNKNPSCLYNITKEKDHIQTKLLKCTPKKIINNYQ